MDKLLYVYTCITGFSLVTMLVTLIILSARRATEAQKYVFSVISVTFLFFLGYIIYQTSNSLNMMLLGIKLELFSVLTIFIIIFMIFQQVYNVLIPRIPMILITVWFVFLCIISVTARNDHDGTLFSLLFSDYSLETLSNGTTKLAFVTNWGFYAITYTLVALGLSTIVIFIWALILSHNHKYRISSAFFLVTLIPQFCLLTFLFTGIDKHNFPYAPLICAIAAILATIMTSREQFSNLYDLAYKELMNSMQNPLFIIDNTFFVRRVNKAAKSIFPEYQNLDDSSYYKMKTVPEIQNIITPPMHEVEKNDRYKAIGKNIYDPEIHKIGRGRHLYGYVLILNNVTDQYSHSSMLQELTHKLSTTLRTNRNREITSREKIMSGALQFIKDKDPDMAAHMRRVGNYTFILARQMRKDGSYTDILTDTYIETLSQIAPLHDVGIFLLPDGLLRKKDKTDEEVKAFQSHTVLGAQMIDRMIVNNYDDLYYRLAREVALYHHEYWDGSGYIQGLRGEEIPLSARIVGGTNTFDNIAMKEEYLASGDFDAIIKELEETKKDQLDPLVLESIISGKEDFKEMYEKVRAEGL
ncbi:MAG: HD domain-containing protein [Treponema sp.]|nr:HD domain-containing protein [Treponema sp.]